MPPVGGIGDHVGLQLGAQIEHIVLRPRAWAPTATPSKSRHECGSSTSTQSQAVCRGLSCNGGHQALGALPPTSSMPPCRRCRMTGYCACWVGITRDFTPCSESLCIIVSLTSPGLCGCFASTTAPHLRRLPAFVWFGPWSLVDWRGVVKCHLLALYMLRLLEGALCDEQLSAEDTCWSHGRPLHVWSRRLAGLAFIRRGGRLRAPPPPLSDFVVRLPGRRPCWRAGPFVSPDVRSEVRQPPGASDLADVRRSQSKNVCL